MMTRLIVRIRSSRSSVGAALGPTGRALLAFCVVAGVVSLAFWQSDAIQPRFFAPILDNDELSAHFIVPFGSASDDSACQLSVRVRSAGSVAEQAVVQLARVGAAGVVDAWSARPDRRGAHRFLDLPPGDYDLTASSPGHALQGAPRFRCEAPGQRAYFDVNLVAATRSLAVRVLGDDNRPIPHADLALAQEEGTQGALAGIIHVRTDEAGMARAALQPGRFQLLAQATEHVGQRRSIQVADADVRLTLRLAFSPTVRGRVVDEGGAPMVGALVSMGAAWAPGARGSAVRTDNSGRFALPVQRGQDLALTARGSGRVGRLFVGNVGDGHGLQEVLLTARPGRTVEGVVLRADGSPHAFGAVRYRIRALGLEGVESADENGQFLLDGMPGSEDVEVWADGTAVGAWGARVAGPKDRRVALTWIAPAY